MKRFLTYFLTGAAVLGLFLGASVLVAKAYVIQPGDTLSALASRFGTTVDKLAADNNIVNKNLIIAGKTLNVGGEQMLGAAAGYTPITGYESRTTQYITASAATIPVASTKDPSGLQIDLTNISPSGTVSVFMSLEPGTTREEPIKCTGVTASSWTGCTRGLPFQGGSETASSTLQKAHNAGSKIIITNVGQFYNQYVNIDGAQTIYGTKAFAGGASVFTAIPKVTSTTAIPLSNDQLVTKYYADTVVSTGFTSANIDATSGLKAAGTAPEKVQVKALSGGGILIDSSTGLYLDGLKVSPPGYYGSGSDGASTTAVGTMTLTRDMYYTTFVVSTGTTLNTAGYRIFASTSIVNNGVIQNTGGAGGSGGTGSMGSAAAGGAAGAAGAASTGGTLRAGSAGLAGVVGGAAGTCNAGVGANGVAGTAGNTTYNAIGSIAKAGSGIGGIGGGSSAHPAGVSSAGAVGAAGTTTSSTYPQNYIVAISGVDFATTTQYFLSGSNGVSSSGGGGYCEDGTRRGASGGGSGGNGGNGGWIMLISPTIENNWIITAAGGAGGSGGAGGDGEKIDSNSNYGGAGGGGGGGNGGNGGVIIFITRTYTNAASVSVSGGTGGSGGAKGSFAPNSSGGTNSATNGSSGATGYDGNIFLLN